MMSSWCARQETPARPTRGRVDVINHALLGDHELYEGWLKNKVKQIDKECGAVSGDYYQVVTQSKRVRVQS